MRTQSQNKRPISPQQLFQKLLTTDFKQIECVDEVSKVKQQKHSLVQQINQLRVQIRNKMGQFDQLQQLIAMRNTFRKDLQHLRMDRAHIDRDVQFEMQKNRLSPMELHQQESFQLEFQDVISKTKAAVYRFRQLQSYALKVQRQNTLLQRENKTVKEQSLQSIGKFQMNEYIGNSNSLRLKIMGRKKYEENKNQQLRLRLCEMEQDSRRQAQRRQIQIAQGNRQRITSFQQKFTRWSR